MMWDRVEIPKLNFLNLIYLFLIEFEVKNKYFTIELLFEFEKGRNHIHPIVVAIYN